MKLDFSQLSRPIENRGGQRGTRGTQATVRVSASPKASPSAARQGDRLADANTVPGLCPPASPTSLAERGTCKPSIGAVSHPSPSVPLDLRKSVAALDREAFEERAAIVEYDAGIPREWTEGFARLQVVRQPDGVPARRWQQVIDDAGHFIDRWAVQAAGLGWRTLDVFGMHATQPEERFNAAGLVWYIAGAEVLAIAEHMAKLRLRSGALQSFRRNVAEYPEAAAIWTLECCDAPARAMEPK